MRMTLKEKDIKHFHASVRDWMKAGVLARLGKVFSDI